jgi:uncharacterized membrane protein YqiK
MVGGIIGGVIGLLVIVFALLGIRYVPANKVGIVTRTILGAKMPQGHVIARNNEMGIQAKTLMPGLYWMFPVVFGVTLLPVTVVPEGKIGAVEAIDGTSLQQGRLLGDSIECNSYQDAKAFLDNGGKKGPQVAILRPGVYRINTKLFAISIHDVVTIDEKEIGIVTAKDGTPLPAGYVISPAPKGDHKYYQDGQAFINEEGYRGTQLETLQPGRYYINPLLFDVLITPKAVVPPGYVAVIISNAGLELEHSVFKKMEGKDDITHDQSEKLLITDKLTRGILADPVATGSYNMNVLAYRPILVPISAITVDWASGEQFRLDQHSEADFAFGGKTPPILKEVASGTKPQDFFKFSQLEAITKDGFHLQVDVRIVIRIEPREAPYIIARFGSVQNLIQQIIHPLIDSSFRNEAGNKDALSFISERVELQKIAHDKAVEVFKVHHVQVQNLLVGFIQAPADLLATQSLKQIAIQQQKQYTEQAQAAKAQIEVREKEARAAKQPDVVNAELSVIINENDAKAAVKKAEGQRDAKKTVADGEAYSAREIGKGIADAYTEQKKAIGEAAIAGIKLAEVLGDKKIKIVPDIYVGSDGGGLNAIAASMFGNLLNKGMIEGKKKSESDPVVDKTSRTK